jgi:hypothetical protein
MGGRSAPDDHGRDHRYLHEFLHAVRIFPRPRISPAGVGVVQSRSQQFAGDQILVGGIPCVGTANLTEKKRLILSFSAYLNNLTKPLTMRRNMKWTLLKALFFAN